MFWNIYSEFPRITISNKTNWERIISKPHDVAGLESLLEEAEECESQAKFFR